LRFGFGIRFCNLDFEFLDVVGPTSLLDVKLFILFFFVHMGYHEFRQVVGVLGEHSFSYDGRTILFVWDFECCS
jgi:hypothetical protein